FGVALWARYRCRLSRRLVLLKQARAQDGQTVDRVRRRVIQLQVACYNVRGMPKAASEILTRKHFQLLAQLRADEAAVLVRNRKKMGAFYLGGLAIECALKACIAKKTRRYEFPRDRKYVDKVYSHDLSELLKLAGLNDQLDQDLKSNRNLATNW